MKNRRGWPAIILVLLACTLPTKKATAQYDKIGVFLRAGAEDAETLVRAYLKPLASGIGGELNTGWFTSASVHKPLGFAIRIRGSVAFIPDKQQQFDIASLPLTMTQATDPRNTVTPTIGGADQLGPEVVVTKDGQQIARFNMPRGSGYHFVPAPMVQASVGLIANTDLMIRFVPQIDLGDYGQFNMLGIGIKHEITEWLPAENIIPVDISIMAGYNNIDLSTALSLKPKNSTNAGQGHYNNQKALTSVDTFTAKIIVGQNWPFLDIYAAAGVETSTMTVALKGDYPVPVRTKTGTQTKTVHNPFKYSQEGANTFSLTAGATLKLFFFDIFAQYTLANYSVFNAGIGFSFR